MWRSLVLVALLTGCANLGETLGGLYTLSPAARPVARGIDGGVARMVLTLCPQSKESLIAAQALLSQVLQSPVETVLANSGGTAEIDVNACPWATVTPAEPAPVSTTRRAR
jgi:hypothetical protein